MHSVALYWKGLRLVESIEHVIRYIAMDSWYVNMVYSQRYEAEYVSKTIEKTDPGADVLYRSRIATV